MKWHLIGIFALLSMSYFGSHAAAQEKFLNEWFSGWQSKKAVSPTEKGKEPTPCCVEGDEIVVKARDFAFIPDETVAFTTFQVKSLLGKLGLKNRIDAIPMFNESKTQMGIDLSEIERCTVLSFGSNLQEIVCIIRTATPCNEAEILAACTPEAKKCTVQGQACHLSQKNKNCICFIEPKLYLVASSETAMKRCLKQSKESERDEESLAAALKTAGKHDFLVWGRLDTLAQLVEFPFPGGVESASISLNIGEQLNLDIQVSCSDEEAQRWAKKALTTGLNLVRMQMMMVPTMMDAAQLFTPNDLGDVKVMGLLPLNLLRIAEKAMQKVEVKQTGNDLSLSIMLPIDAKMLRKEISSLVRLMGPLADSGTTEKGGTVGCSPGTFIGFQTWTGGMTLPAPQCLDHPQYYPATPFSNPAQPSPFPQPSSSASVPPNVGAVYNLPPTLPVFTLPPSSIPSGVARDPIPSTPPNVIPASANVPSIPSATVATSQPIATSSATMKLSVANVRKEAAMLFTMTNDGKMTFSQKLSAGEAVDLQATPGLRWFAIFSDKPEGLTFTPKQGENIWLLR